MAKQHGARQQKRLAKQKAKRNEKRRQLARACSNNPAIRLSTAESWPIVASLVPKTIWDMGLGQMVLARRAPGGKIACAVFLVDVFCLGVKDAFWRMLSVAEYEETIDEIGRFGSLQPVAPEYFAKLLTGAVEYAKSAGFFPHPDYRGARLLLAGIDPSQCDEEFEFGHEGKPFYVEGPNDGALPQFKAYLRGIDEDRDPTVLLLDAASGELPGPAGDVDDDFDDVPAAHRAAGS
jgi:hypothetical protein